MTDLEKALRSPQSVYGSPEEVLSDPGLDREAKRAVLKSWEQDARELAVAEEESMAGGEPNVLDRVLKALRALSEGAEGEESKPDGGGGNGRGPKGAGKAAGTKAEAGGAGRAGDAMTASEEVLHPGHPLSEALHRMAERDLPLMPVADGDDIVGILTRERIDEHTDHSGHGPGESTVKEALSPELLFCYANDDLQTVRKLMEHGGSQCALVLNRDNELLGVITRDAVERSLGSSASPRSDPATLGRRLAWRKTKPSGWEKEEEPGVPRDYSVKPKVRR